MIIDNCYVVEPLTAEEVKLANEVILAYREEKAKKEAIKQNEEYLRSVVIDTIDAIGLEETKRIIREINRNLRGLQ